MAFFALVQNYEDIIKKKNTPRPIILWYFAQIYIYFLTLSRFVLYADLFSIAKLK